MQSGYNNKGYNIFTYPENIFAARTIDKADVIFKLCLQIDAYRYEIDGEPAADEVKSESEITQNMTSDLPSETYHQSASL